MPSTRRTATPPYPIDDAAVHHVFPGGWIWILRFANGVTSAGAAVTDRLAAELRLHEGGPAWTRLLNRLPSVRDQFARAEPTFPLVYAPRLGFRVKQVVGPNWALLPSAAGVIDPLLSTGFAAHAPWHSTTYGRDGGPRPGRRRASARPRARPPPGLGPASAPASARPLPGLGPGSARARPGLVDYERQTQAELDATEQLVAALYASMADFEVFKRLTLLYFAAASYTEAVRRLGHPERAPGFLLHADPPVRAGAAALRRVGAHDARRVRGSPRRAAAPLRGHRSGHRAVRYRRPARSQPARLVSGARRPTSSPARRSWAPRPMEIDQLLARSGFAGEAPAAGGSGQPA